MVVSSFIEGGVVKCYLSITSVDRVPSRYWLLKNKQKKQCECNAMLCKNVVEYLLINVVEMKSTWKKIFALKITANTCSFASVAFKDMYLCIKQSVWHSENRSLSPDAQAETSPAPRSSRWVFDLFLGLKLSQGFSKITARIISLSMSQRCWLHNNVQKKIFEDLEIQASTSTFNVLQHKNLLIQMCCSTSPFSSITHLSKLTLMWDGLV